MCGICGIISCKNVAEDIERRVRAMCVNMAHRGPDGDGFFIRQGQGGPSVALGHRRLMIIDLTSAGRQPMSNEDGSLQLTLNGEIYNYKELRRGLEEQGHVFRSHTDTEVVVHLYEQYGPDCVKKLRGMFAFAIWDDKKKALFLARDRVGKKPLLYFFDGKTFCFASEFKALFSCGLVPKETDAQAIDQYLSFGYVPAPQSVYRGVFKLPPAHALTLENGALKVWRYWELDYSRKIRISEEDAAEEVLRILKDAVKIRLYSDVPLGAFLSGGIDSSAVVALMSGLSGARPKTFSVGFSDADYNELKYARAVAEKYGTEHREFMVTPKAAEILPLLAEHYGEPYADSSCVPTYYIAKETRQHVTVALNGDGGDELFAGYERYQAMLLAENFQRLPFFMRQIILKCCRMLPDSPDHKNKLRRLKRFIMGLNMGPASRYTRWIGIFSGGLKSELYSRDFSVLVSMPAAEKYLGSFLDQANGAELLDRLLLTDTMTYLPNDLLVKVDIASMSCSLEARSPFLDHVLIEFAASLPVQFKIKGGERKFILKRAIKGLVPAGNIYRAKMGFGVPVAAWLRGELKGFLYEHIFSAQAISRQYFRQDALKEMFDSHMGGRKDHSFQLWALLMLELWHRQTVN